MGLVKVRARVLERVCIMEEGMRFGFNATERLPQPTKNEADALGLFSGVYGRRERF